MAPSSFFLLFIFFLIAVSTKTITIESRPAEYFPSRAIYQSSFHKQTKISKSKIPYKTHYFPQILDHFTFQPQSSKIFYQKYLINSEYWHQGASIFVYTGNEGNIEWFANNTGFMLDIAPKFQALLVFIEHRFYGKSMPFGKDSYKSAKTLGYLTSQQALADFAVLIRSLKQNLSSEASPVVVFGGSYGGMLAAWFRLKYPHIAIGALASSAPILQFDNIIPWSSFYDAVSKDYKDASLSCYEVIKGSWAELLTHEQRLPELSKTFRTCKNLESVYSARNWLWTAFTYTAMVNYPTEANFMMPLPAYPVREMCKIIDGLPAGTTKLNRVFAGASLYYNYSHTEKCFNIENGTDAHGLHGWDWQACTEMVMPMTSSKESMFPPFSFSYKDFEENCLKSYGVKPRSHWITTEFGGSRIDRVLKRSASNIIFSNGMQDPWSRGSVLKNISSSIIALVTDKGAHHVDFRSATKEDPEWLKLQRRQEVEIILVSALCVSGPALYWKFKKGFKFTTSSPSCTPCICDCPPPLSLLKIAPGLANLSVTDCGKDDPDLKEEMEKQFVDLLTEELKLQETVDVEHHHHMNITFGETRRVATQYQREAEKCNIATETCEVAREHAESLLIKERKMTSLWERRALQMGWVAK